MEDQRSSALLELNQIVLYKIFFVFLSFLAYLFSYFLIFLITYFLLNLRSCLVFMLNTSYFILLLVTAQIYFYKNIFIVKIYIFTYLNVKNLTITIKKFNLNQNKETKINQTLLKQKNEKANSNARQCFSGIILELKWSHQIFQQK